MRAALVSIATCVVPVLASAAEVTDAPPKFRGDVHVGYTGAFQQVGLEEAGETYGIRNTTSHDVGLRFEAAVWRGVLLHIGLPITIQQRIAFPAARQMLYEPVTGQGSYTNGQAATVDPIVTGGLQGAWFGLGVVPFSQTYDRSLPVDARFDLSVRTGGKQQTMYSASRGASPGGAALRLAGAFSTRSGVVDAYSMMAYQHEFPTGVDVIDNSGRTWATGLRIRAASTLDAVIGGEFVVMEKADQDSRVAIDVHAAVGYRSWQDQASGFWLPTVLEPSRRVTVTRSDYVQLGIGLGLDYHFNKWLGLRLGAEGQYFTPHTIESAYSVRTDGPSYGITWWTGLVGRVRLKGD